MIQRALAVIRRPAGCVCKRRLLAQAVYDFACPCHGIAAVTRTAATRMAVTAR